MLNAFRNVQRRPWLFSRGRHAAPAAWRRPRRTARVRPYLPAPTPPAAPAAWMRRCSRCGQLINTPKPLDPCPNCGAVGLSAAPMPAVTAPVEWRPACPVCGVTIPAPDAPCPACPPEEPAARTRLVGPWLAVAERRREAAQDAELAALLRRAVAERPDAAAWQPPAREMAGAGVGR